RTRSFSGGRGSGGWRPPQHAFSSPLALSDGEIAGRGGDDQPQHTLSRANDSNSAPPHPLPGNPAARGRGAAVFACSVLASTTRRPVTCPLPSTAPLPSVALSVPLTFRTHIAFVS